MSPTDKRPKIVDTSVTSEPRLGSVLARALDQKARLGSARAIFQKARIEKKWQNEPIWGLWA